MSRHDSDREDLLREATALVERVELNVPAFPEPVVVGFRRDGSASFFFGADPVYQFNSAAQLRRAYLGGLLYKAEQGRLISLRRERRENVVALVRCELSAQQADRLVSDLQAGLAALQNALANGCFEIAGQVPPDAPVTSRVANWLAALPLPIVIASQPNAG